MTTIIKPKFKTPRFLNLILIAIGLCLAYVIIIFLIKCVIYGGYNFLFFTDNLFQINSFNPIVSWAFAGSFIGSIVGVLIAIKRFKLSKVLALFPIGLAFIFLGIMYAVNKPGNYTGNLNAAFSKPTLQDVNTIQHYDYYITTMQLNMRNGPSTRYGVSLVVSKGSEVTVIEKNIWDKNHKEWFKIKYNGYEGYVNSKYLHFSRSE